jgi:hypothetical protein
VLIEVADPHLDVAGGARREAHVEQRRPRLVSVVPEVGEIRAGLPRPEVAERAREAQGAFLPQLHEIQRACVVGEHGAAVDTESGDARDTAHIEGPRAGHRACVPREQIHRPVAPPVCGVPP